MRPLILILVLVWGARAQLSHEADLENQLELTKRELVHLRALAQANEVQSRRALQDATGTVGEKARILHEQELANGKLTIASAVDNARSMQKLKDDLEVAQNEGRFKFYEVIFGQIITLATVLGGFWFRLPKDKRFQAAVALQHTEQQKDFMAYKKEVGIKLDGIDDILNHRKAPTGDWKDTESGSVK